MHFGSPLDPLGLRGEAKLNHVYYNIGQGKAEPHIIKLKPLQCFIICLVSVPSSCVHQLTYDVPKERVLPSHLKLMCDIKEVLLSLSKPQKHLLDTKVNSHSRRKPFSMNFNFCGHMYCITKLGVPSQCSVVGTTHSWSFKFDIPTPKTIFHT